jgi:hypothetical protein
MVVIAVRVFPIERHRPTGDFDVLNGEALGKSRVGYNVDRASGFRIHTVAALWSASGCGPQKPRPTSKSTRYGEPA